MANGIFFDLTALHHLRVPKIVTDTGKITLQTYAGTTFNMLQFGGTTASYPALKRAGNTIQVRNADDSGYADLTVRNLTVNLTPSATAGLVQLAFRKNGAFDSTTRIIAGLEAGTAGFVLSGSAQFDHDADDYFEAWIFCQYNSLHFTAAAYCNFFDGEVLSLGD